MVFYFLVTVYTGWFYMYLGIQRTPFNNAMMFFFNRMSLPLSFSWIVYLFRSVGQEIHLLKNDWLVRCLNRLITVKGLKDAPNPKFENNNSEQSDHKSKDYNNNSFIQQSKCVSKQQTVTIYHIMSRVVSSIYLAHHFIFIYMHSRSRQAIPCEFFDVVSLN